MCRMRQVWKPLAWAEMPRMACMPTGRPIILSCRRPVQSVHGTSSVDLLLERRMRQLGGDAADGRRPARRSPSRRCSGAYSGDRKRSASSWNTGTASRPSASLKRPRQRRRHVRRQRIGAACPVVLSCASGLAVGVAREQPVVVGAGIADHQPGRVGVAHEVVEIDLAASCSSSCTSARREQPVGAGLDADPLVGDGVVAGAHRIDGDHLDAALLELAERDLDRVGGVVLGHAEQHEIARVVPVGVAELPERAAERVEARPPPCSPSRSRHAPRSWACRTASPTSRSATGSGRGR